MLSGAEGRGIEASTATGAGAGAGACQRSVRGASGRTISSEAGAGRGVSQGGRAVSWGAERRAADAALAAAATAGLAGLAFQLSGGESALAPIVANAVATCDAYLWGADAEAGRASVRLPEACDVDYVRR